MSRTESYVVVSVEQRTVRSALEVWIQPCFSLILSVSVWISYSPSLSISQIQILCKSVGRQQLGSVPLSCAIMGGILRGSRVHITPPHVRQECLVCTHTKALVIFYCLLLFLRVMFSPLWCYLLFILCCLALLSFSLSVCGLLSFPSASNSTSWWFRLPLCQWFAFDWGGRLGCLVMAT